MKTPVLPDSISSFTYKSTTALKAVGSGDDFVVGEGGEYIIFRMLPGRSEPVPIEVSPEEYLEMLASEGFNVDPADQSQLHAAMNELEALQNSAEIGGAEYQSKIKEAL